MDWVESYLVTYHQCKIVRIIGKASVIEYIAFGIFTRQVALLTVSASAYST